jgi:poly(3-hydroxybutyrate) depolymerase
MGDTMWYGANQKAATRRPAPNGTQGRWWRRWPQWVWGIGVLVVCLGAGACRQTTRSPGGERKTGAQETAGANAGGPQNRGGGNGSARAGARKGAGKKPFALKTPLALAVRWPKKATGSWQRVSFAGSAKDRVRALWRSAAAGEGKKQSKAKRPAVILGHGHNGDKRGMAQGFGEAFADRSVHLLAVDHPFQGERRRSLDEDICPPRYRLLVKRWIRAVRDLRRAVAVLRARKEVDSARIGYLGFSLGAVLGGVLAGHEPKLAAAVLIAPAARWEVLAATRSRWKLGWNTALLGRWLRCAPCKRLLARVDPARTIQRFAPRPLLVVVGQNDLVIRPLAGLALYERAGKGAQLIKHSGGHAPGPALRVRAARWLVKKLTQP